MWSLSMISFCGAGLGGFSFMLVDFPVRKRSCWSIGCCGVGTRSILCSLASLWWTENDTRKKWLGTAAATFGLFDIFVVVRLYRKLRDVRQLSATSGDWLRPGGEKSGPSLLPAETTHTNLESPLDQADGKSDTWWSFVVLLSWAYRKLPEVVLQIKMLFRIRSEFDCVELFERLFSTVLQIDAPDKATESNSPKNQSVPFVPNFK